MLSEMRYRGATQLAMDCMINELERHERGELEKYGLKRKRWEKKHDGSRREHVWNRPELVPGLRDRL